MSGCRVFRHSVLHMFREAVDKTRKMEHPGTSRNIPEHPETSNNCGNYVKKCVKLNFGLAHVTIWSAQIGKVTLCFFSRPEQLCLEMNAYGRTFHRGKSIEKYMRSLIIDDILSGGGNVSTEYYSGSFRATGSKYKVSGVTVSNVWKTFCQQEKTYLSTLPLGINRKGWQNLN